MNGCGMGVAWVWLGNLIIMVRFNYYAVVWLVATDAVGICFVCFVFRRMECTPKTL